MNNKPNFKASINVPTLFDKPSGFQFTGRHISEDVEVIRAPMRHHKAGLSYTASGYGDKIPTEFMVRYLGRWRRVYCRIFSNIGTLFIQAPRRPKNRIVVDIWSNENAN